MALRIGIDQSVRKRRVMRKFTPAAQPIAASNPPEAAIMSPIPAHTDEYSSTIQQSSAESPGKLRRGVRRRRRSILVDQAEAHESAGPTEVAKPALSNKATPLSGTSAREIISTLGTFVQHDAMQAEIALKGSCKPQTPASPLKPGSTTQHPGPGPRKNLAASRGKPSEAQTRQLATQASVSVSNPSDGFVTRQLLGGRAGGAGGTRWPLARPEDFAVTQLANSMAEDGITGGETGLRMLLDSLAGDEARRRSHPQRPKSSQSPGNVSAAAVKPTLTAQHRPWRGAGPFSPEEEAGRAIAHMQRRRGQEAAPPAGIAMTSPIAARLSEMPSLGTEGMRSLEAQQSMQKRKQAISTTRRLRELQAGVDPRKPEDRVLARASNLTSRRSGSSLGQPQTHHGRGSTGIGDDGGGRKGSMRGNVLASQAIAAGKHDDRGSWLPRDTVRAIALDKAVQQADKLAAKRSAAPGSADTEAAGGSIMPRHMQVMRQLSTARLGRDVTSGVQASRGRAAIAEGLAAEEVARERARVAQGVDWLRESLRSFYPQWLREREDFQPLLQLREDSARTAALEIMQVASEAGLNANAPPANPSTNMGVLRGAVTDQSSVNAARSAAAAVVELAAQSQRSVAALVHACAAAPSQRRTLDTLIIAKTLARMPCCVGMSGDEIRAVAGGVYLARADAGEPIYEQGDAAHSFYVLLQGTLSVAVAPIGRMHTLHPGEWFGEAALVQNEARASTVTAETACTLMVLTQEDFSKAMKQSETRHMLRNVEFLQDLPFFGGWSRPRLSRLVSVFVEVRVPAGTVLASQGDECKRVLVVLDGSLELWHTATVRGTNRWPQAVYSKPQQMAIGTKPEESFLVDDRKPTLTPPQDAPMFPTASRVAQSPSHVNTPVVVSQRPFAPAPPPRLPPSTPPSKQAGASASASASALQTRTSPQRASPQRASSPIRHNMSGFASHAERKHFRKRVGVDHGERHVLLRKTSQVGIAKAGALYGLHFVCRRQPHPFTVRTTTAVRMLTANAALFQDNAANSAAAESYARITTRLPAPSSQTKMKQESTFSESVVAHCIEITPQATSAWGRDDNGPGRASYGNDVGTAASAASHVSQSHHSASARSASAADSASSGRGGRRQSISESKLGAADLARKRRQSQQGVELLRQRRASIDVLRSMTADEAAMALRRTLFGLELAQREKRDSLRDHRLTGLAKPVSRSSGAFASRTATRRSRRGSVGFRARPFGVDAVSVSVVAAAKAKALADKRRR